MNTVKDPAGISKFLVICLSMDFAWSVENEFWFMHRNISMPVDHMGMTLRRALSDSTCSIVHRLHESKADPSGFRSLSRSLILQALFRHLERVRKVLIYPQHNFGNQYS